ncbi:MAG: hypothetical protein ACPG4U_07610 [Pseudomonadales bacterium]
MNVKAQLMLLAITSLISVQLFAHHPRTCQSGANVAYRVELANLLLTLTAEPGQVHLLKPISEKDPSQARCITLLERGKVDLIFLGATAQLLSKFRAVKRDIHRGMLGYRVLLIRREDAARFAQVKSLQQLRGFTGGFGSQWGDFRVFALNRLPVVGTAVPSSLISMLQGRRFDYFHRGLHEAWRELERFDPQGETLMIAPNLALVYDYPVYFMVAKGNQALAKRLERGFEIAQRSGQLDALFRHHYGYLAERANLSERTLIPIDYPTPVGLPTTNRDFWLAPASQ